MKKNYLYLFKNIGLLTLSNFGSKILVFLLIPLYTSVLTTADYGIYDLFYTSISLLLPILTLNISEGVLRFALDKENDESIIYSIGFKVTGIGFGILVVACVLNLIFNLSPLLNEYGFYFVLLYLTTAVYQLLTSFIRGIDKVTILSISSVLNTIAILIFNILFLLVIKEGLIGYFWANILGTLLPIVYLVYKIHRYNITLTKRQDKGLEREIIAYSRPLILNSLGWWLNNAADRYIVIAFCGVAASGVYSVGYKIPSILNIFANIFNQAWVLSSVKSFDKKEDITFFEKVYSNYNMMLVILCSLLIASSKLLAVFLYANAFYKAWIYVPFLLIANVFGAISGFAGGIFSAAKDSKIYSISTLIGAGANIIFNVILVYSIGVIGAAISTMLSYFVVWLIRLYTMKKYISLNLTLLRDCLAYLLLVVQSVALIVISKDTVMYLSQCVAIVLLILLFRREVAGIKSSLLTLFN
ncbi:oligosaccharide flippase family protein [Streptococcus sciuri]|uniref:Oligosaccharide flippase family protein n=1 Tax=Streptococcus sciuri TaxID=2973939 RepID=A0ABT2F5C7_9STRE|nr:oligosaccharide flippase family protein [Streptococcus sciuri]MCS4487686.1 oligosaccharide flippase family protein [Streptococcus sciuri]